MATFLQNNYTAINFNALKETNVFETFDYLLIYGFQLNSAISKNVNLNPVPTSGLDPVLGTNWSQTFTGNASNGTHTFTNSVNGYSIQYVGSNIGVDADGVYRKVTYTLPNLNNNLVTVEIEGTMTKFSSGDVGSGTINKISYSLGSLKVELFGTITKTFVDGNPSFNTFTGTITGFNFQDANGQLEIKEISPPLDLPTLFDDLTFNQLDGQARSQVTATTNSSFTDLFALLDTEAYKGGTDTVIANPDTGSTQGGEGSSTNPKLLKSLEDNFTLQEGSTDYYANGNELNNVMTGNSARNFFEGRAGNDTLNGAGGDDSLKGEAGLDILNGGEGNDILDGGAGKDTLTGGNGDDTYVLDTALNGKFEDKVVEARNAGSDTLAYRSAFGVQARPVTLKLIRNFENLDVSLTNTNYNLTGDAGNNVLTGNLQNNVLDGGRGADRLVGGGGADTYILDNAGDVVIETLDADLDTVNIRFFSDFALTDNGSSNFSNIENAILGHTRALGLTGNALNNTLTGNRAANTINGSDGNDTINGAAGNDTLNGDAGNDTVIGGAGNDILNGGSGNDTLSGGRGRDTFDFNDKGTAGNPSVDTITDFSIRERDVLDLRDLLDGESKADINALLNFIDISANEIRISSTGGFTGGTYNSSAEDARITLNADLFGLAKVTTGSEADLLTALISKNNLIID